MRHINPTEEQVAGWKTWLDQRPEHVREVAKNFDPWTLYKLKPTNQRVFVVAFDDNEEPYKGHKVTLRIGVSGQFNLVSHERTVFGISPDDLEECDLPDPTETVGSLDLPVEELKRLMAMPEADRNLELLKLAMNFNQNAS